jgi:hypothetical protein
MCDPGGTGVRLRDPCSFSSSLPGSLGRFELMALNVGGGKVTQDDWMVVDRKKGTVGGVRQPQLARVGKEDTTWPTLPSQFKISAK